jgi:hypothetical protein
MPPETVFDTRNTAAASDARLSVIHRRGGARAARDSSFDPVANDLAWFTLDLLVSEAGFKCHGVNLMRRLAQERHAGTALVHNWCSDSAVR